MPLGYCKVCDKLIPIALRPAPGGGASLDHVRLGVPRAAIWYPSPHEDVDGKPCTGTRRPC